MTPEAAIAALEAQENPQKAAEMAAYHKIPRRYLGLSTPQIDALTKEWRAAVDLPTRLALADGLWQSDIYEARVAAAKLLIQARIRPEDTAAWELICSWVPDFDSWAIADHASMAGQRRLLADPTRIATLRDWTTSDHLWTRRAVLVMTLPWTKMPHPKPADLAIREVVLSWAASYVPDRRWFIQKAIGWWLRDLSPRDPDRVRAFLTEHGDAMKPFARKEAARLLPA
ncbi:DNA alkylation repair protein [Pelagovum sp. HNIBRBA483]|uniref:DNA alkylation repair protein n=1 Tax=Pelagovum sp. HNIBRBA483 TaxID=3233341 RepID=UPI0034A3C881